jgi:thiamine biosynthesis protein ThiS
MSGTHDDVTITLNGESRTVPQGHSVRDLLGELRLDARYLAVEINRAVIPRARHVETLLQPGDIIEIVTLVGGG